MPPTREELRENLIKKAKVTGAISYDDILAILPSAERNVALLDDVMDSLLEVGIEVVAEYPTQESNQQAVSKLIPDIYVTNIVTEILQLLKLKPETIYGLTPDAFELLICNRLEAMGHEVVRVTDNVNSKDGGIDIIAIMSHLPFNGFIAIQAKHHRTKTRKTGAKVVRELQGIVNENRYLQSGLIVTNTAFTQDAIWSSYRSRKIMGLRDWSDLIRWIRDDFTGEHIFRELPDEIEIGNGIVIPRSRFGKNLENNPKKRNNII